MRQVRVDWYKGRIQDQRSLRAIVALGRIAERRGCKRADVSIVSNQQEQICVIAEIGTLSAIAECLKEYGFPRTLNEDRKWSFAFLEATCPAETMVTILQSQAQDIFETASPLQIERPLIDEFRFEPQAIQPEAVS